MSRVLTMTFASIYELYVKKVERKGRSEAELDEVISWLLGFDDATLRAHLDAGTTLEELLTDTWINPNATMITGVICGVRVEDIEDPLMQRIRYLDKLVDELARGKRMGSILRS